MIKTVGAMKFGRNLPQFTVPEWSDYYIKYKALKKLIKSVAEQVKAGQEADLAGKRRTLSLPCFSGRPSNHRWPMSLPLFLVAL